MEWSTFKIKIEDHNYKIPVEETVTVFYDSDSCSYFKLKRDEEYFKEHQKFWTESKRFILTKSERDSLYNWAADAITKPILSDSHVSDYAGKYVTLSLSKDNTKISCSYSSVMTWTGISRDMLKISSLTFERVQ